MEKENSDFQGPFHGPNDYGFLHNQILKCSEYLKEAQILYSEGHYPHSNAKVIPQDHPLRIAMKELEKLDWMYARFANREPNPKFFSTYEPSLENQTRWP